MGTRGNSLRSCLNEKCSSLASAACSGGARPVPAPPPRPARDVPGQVDVRRRAVGDRHGVDEWRWKAGSTAVSTFSIRRTTVSISSRAAASSSAISAPVPAAFPAADTLSSGAIRDHAEGHRVERVDMAAEGAGQHDAVDRLDAEAVHQEPRACHERRLGELDRAHVVLIDEDRGLARMEHVGEGPPLLDDAPGARLRRARDGAVRQQDAGEVHLGQRLDDARAADAGDPGGGGGLRKTRLVGPEVAADDPDLRLQRLPVDPHPLDRTGRSPLAGRDLRALEGGPGGRGRRQQPLPLPSTISALVPTSTSSTVSAARWGASESTMPAASAPTWPAMQGRT